MTDTKDIIDAEFVTIANGSAASAQSSAPIAASKAVRDEDGAQLGLFRDGPTGGATLREELLGKKRMSLPVFTLVAILLSGAAFLVAGGYTLLMPTQSLTEAAAPAVAPVLQEPLVIEGLQLSHSNRGGHFVLTVRARIKNTGTADMTVPPLVISFPDHAHKKRYFIPRGESLQSGEQMAFTSHLPIDEIPATDPVISFDK